MFPDKDSWGERLSSEFDKEYFKRLIQFLRDEEQANTVFPPKEERFNAYHITPFENVKVVILGQDPYHGLNQAHGLSFSVKGQALPPSLKNIYKELVDDMGCEMPQNGDLTSWAKQGVFLLNAVLSVQASSAGSHQQKGWEPFTDTTIKLLSDEREHLVFILWGKPAQSKEKLIDTSKHLVLKAPHPSPLSSYRGFFGSKPFSKSNAYLEANGITPIDWCL
ncbi:MAG: uracil-DNA glycosylase [Sulfurimonadaceae bacterium]